MIPTMKIKVKTDRKVIEISIFPLKILSADFHILLKVCILRKFVISVSKGFVTIAEESIIFEGISKITFC